jgi:hypothetical protein
MNKNFDASRTDGSPLFCLVCENEIRDGHWFARLPMEPGQVAMCRPRCMEVFLQDRESFVRKFAASMVAARS